MPEKKFDLGDYVEVKERIARFYELFGQGRLVTGEVRLTNEPDGVPRVMVQGLAYRSPDDQLPGVGWSWMALPGTTSYTKGSELENVETSAWGRAIGSLGILIDRSIASANEVQNKQGETIPGIVGTREHPAPQRRPGVPGAIHEMARAMSPYDGLIGTVEIAKDSPDFLPHVGPEGAVLSFKLVSPAGGIKVIAKGSLAEVISLAKDQTVGERVTCWGRIATETFTPKGTKLVKSYEVLALERIKTPTYTLPAEDAEPTEALPPPLFDDLPEPPDDVSLVGEKVTA